MASLGTRWEKLPVAMPTVVSPRGRLCFPPTGEASASRKPASQLGPWQLLVGILSGPHLRHQDLLGRGFCSGSFKTIICLGGRSVVPRGQVTAQILFIGGFSSEPSGLSKI
ncbi:hypothetical protein LEMLEM_LOCUS27915 [Lemmus lemmus]